MAKVTTKLVKKEVVASGTMAFHFAKPEGWQFVAGQTIDLTLINPPQTDAEGNTRTFSIASTPFEPNLMIATRMRDTAFKNTLKDAEVGLEIEMDGPFGSFNLHKDTSKPAVFLAGGIGITPFRSMIINATQAHLPHQIYLFYSNRTPEDTAFGDDLKHAQAQNPNFHLIQTMTQLKPDNTPWTGEKGYINAEMLKNHLSDLDLPIYYIAGPPPMVASLKQVLIETGISEDNIKFEEFPGY